MNVLNPQNSLNSRNPIYIIGAGGIVRDAHLPAYKLAGFPVAGIFDIDGAKARALAVEFAIPVVFDTLEDLVQAAGTGAVYDIALPATALPQVLAQLPLGAAVLMQKPMGNDLAEAQTILEICTERNLLAAVNFQLRYAPFIQAARSLLAAGKIGELLDIEININVFTPWHLWSFLEGLPRMEILYHSIHYIDLVRSFLGNPKSVFAKSTGHPALPKLASVRSAIIMDYGDMHSVLIRTNHSHDFSPETQHAYIKLEGTEGAIHIDLGLLKNYPEGSADTIAYISKKEGNGWQQLPLDGSWFPHAFIGSMQQVIHAATGGPLPDNSVADCIHTMACVEAAYESSAVGGVVPPQPVIPINHSQ